MNTEHIHSLLQKIAALSKAKKGPEKPPGDAFKELRTYADTETARFVDDLAYQGQQVGLTFLRNQMPTGAVGDFLDSVAFPVIFFHRTADGPVLPLLVYREEAGRLVGEYAGAPERFDAAQVQIMARDFLVERHAADPALDGQVLFVTSFPVSFLADQAPAGNEADSEPLTPLRRLLNLLGTERRDITYIYVYAIVVGLISLVLPLGIQAMIRLISGGMVFSSVVVIIAVVIMGLLASGGLQIMQISLVEILQQRIFAKAAFEFAYRVPKIRLQALSNFYPPELMNRFFDVINVQKALPKLLVDLTGAVLQILFGLVLLSFYHPFFLAFSVVLLGVLAVIFNITGPKGLKTSLYESKYKYKIVYWLEEVARTVKSFRLAGDTSLHMQKMDGFVSNYLYYRKSHFSVLRTQLIYIVLFKVLVIGGLLILGTLLVVDRQITLGQFVASEIVIVLVVGSVEKIIVNMDTVYDLLTAVEKIGTVTDLPLEKERGARVQMETNARGLEVTARELHYTYGNGSKALEGVSFTLQPGEKVALAGTHAAGKNTLARLLAGVMTDYQGALVYNGISLRDLHPHSLRTVVSSYLFEDTIFEGSILDNIAMNRTGVGYEDVRWALERAGLSTYVNQLSEGVSTHIGAEGRQPSDSVAHKILLARAIAARPKLLVIKDTLPEMRRSDRTHLLQYLTSPDTPWTLVAVSNDPVLLAKCDRVLLFDAGKLVAQGPYRELENHPVLKEAIFQD